MIENPMYRIIMKKGWSYVVGDPTPPDSGPWHYQWEAQEYADELNLVNQCESREWNEFPQARST